MKHIESILTYFIYLILVLIQLLNADQKVPNQITYPTIKQIPKTFTYLSASDGDGEDKNATIEDSYTWLEGNIQTDENVKEFIEIESNLTKSYLLQNCQNSERILKSIQEATNGYDDYFDMYFINQEIQPSFYLYSHKESGKNTRVWFKATLDEMKIAKKSNLDYPPGMRILEENQSTISSVQISSDGNTLAYLLSNSEKDNATWHFRLIDDSIIPYGEKDLPDLIPNGDGNLIFINNDRGFIYTQVEQSGETFRSTINYHELGTSTIQDFTLFGDTENESLEYWTFTVNDDQDWLFVFGSSGTNKHSNVYATYLSNQTISDNMNWICISRSEPYSIYHLSVIEDYWYIQTNRNAPNSKIVKVKLDWNKAKPLKILNETVEQQDFIDIIPQQPFSELIMGLMIDTDISILIFNEKGKHSIYLYDLLTGIKLQQILLNETLSDLVQFSSSKEGKRAILTYSSITSPRKIYEVFYDDDKNEVTSSLLTEQHIKGINSQNFVTKTYSTSNTKDNPTISYMVVSKDTLEKSSSKPALMHINSFSEIQSFKWNPSLFTFMNRFDANLVFVDQIENSDTFEKRQKFVDNIISVAQELVDEGIVPVGKLIIEGKQEGALEAAVAVNQAPENTFSIFLAEDGIFDIFLLERTLKTDTIVKEYWNVSNPEDFDIILGYSPIQNVNNSQSVQYPATLLTPQIDDPLYISQSLKFIAKLQNDFPNNVQPMLMHLDKIREEEKAEQVAVYQQCFVQSALGLESKDENSGILVEIANSLST